MPVIQPDERAVYLALRNVFAGTDARTRVTKKIREKIRVQTSAELAALLREHGMDKVCDVAKRLLETEIFQSTLKAKLRFPELFEVSPAQSASRTVSGQEAAEAEDASLRRAAEKHHEDCETQQTRNSYSGFDPPVAALRKGFRSEVALRVPSLYPAYLPMTTQHVLMNELQSILEKACYDFGNTAMPHVLKEKGWSCAECVELNIWPKFMVDALDKLPEDAVESVGKPLPSLLADITQIRHTAVHRLPVTVSRIEQFLMDAASLTRLLGNEIHSGMVVRLRHNTEAVVDEIRRNKDLLETRCTEIVQRVRRQQAELDREVHTAIDGMLQEDREFRLAKGRALEQAILSVDKVGAFASSESYEEVPDHSSGELAEQGELRKECDSVGNNEDYM